jgi:bacterioferritin B
MISEQLGALLIAQLDHELNAHQGYSGISIYFQRQSLNRWGALFRDQAIEEAQHAAKIMAFLIDNEVDFDLPAVGVATTHFASAAHAVQAALDGEMQVTGQFNDIAAAAQASGDNRTAQFLLWFIDEQVEEERKMRGLLDLIGSGINLFQAEPLLEVGDTGG